jgi:two-component system sensor histidine kinase YesM
METRKWHWRRTSLRYKLIASVLIMTLPLVGMLLYNNYYAIHVVRGQVADSYKNMLKLYMNQTDDSLNDIDSYLSTVAGNGYDLLSLSQSVTDTDYYSAKIYLFNKLNRDSSLYDSLSSFFVYTEHRQDYLDVSKRDQSNLEEKEKIATFIIELIHSRQYPQGSSVQRWQHIQIGQDDYLVDIVHSGDAYLGGLIRTDLLLEPLDALQIGEGGEVLLADMQGKQITETEVVGDYGVELQKNLNNYYISGTTKKFLVVGAQSNKGEFQLVTLIPDQHILANLPYLQWIVWLITIAGFLFIPLGLYSMRMSILVPLYRILRTMKKVREGDWSSRVELSDTSGEFQLIGGAFNAMMTEVEILRINVYEEQLNKQKEELQRLQLQVNPHFFLNTLNIVYNLAKVKNYELILEMSMSLIHYFRFMFRSNTSFVQLKDEIEHTKNYLRIQNLRFPGQMTWNMDAPVYLSDVPIPPLVIQSFVENSIKHAVTMDKPINISVHIDLLDEESDARMKISIKDTGFGFSEQVLQELQAGRSIENERGEHTGIWNVERRLKLLYGKNVSIRYANVTDSGGAAVDIILPISPGMEETR